MLSWLGLTSVSNALTNKSNFRRVPIQNTPTGSAPDFVSLVLNSLSYTFRQTVFYTPSTLTVTQGDNIVGRLSCAPNTRNNRDLDIGFAYKLEHDEKELLMQYKMCVVFLKILFSLPRVYADQMSGVKLFSSSLSCTFSH